MTNDNLENRSDSMPFESHFVLACDPRTPGEILARLAESANTAVLGRVAEHRNSPRDLLARLARHAHPDVRSAVTENDSAPLELIFELAQDESPDVRYSIAENARMPWAVLQQLAEDENPYVAHRASTTIKRLRSAREQLTRLPIRTERRAEQLG